MKKENKKRRNIKKIFILIMVILLIVVISKTGSISKILLQFLEKSSISAVNKYKIIKQDTNTNYSGMGQEKVLNQDGYYTTFTTDAPYQKTYIEYKQNGNASWSKHTYWDDYMENSGCGITAMAIILSGYGKNVTPEDLRKKYYPVIDYDLLSMEFYETYGIQASGFLYDSAYLSKGHIKQHLLTNRPVLICVWSNPNENRWTTTSHYMVLLASADNMVYVSNPNGGINDSKSSGWYQYEEVIPYIAKALFIESYE